MQLSISSASETALCCNSCLFIHSCITFCLPDVLKRRNHAKLFLYSVTELQGLTEIQPRLLSHLYSKDTEKTKLLELLLGFV